MNKLNFTFFHVCVLMFIAYNSTAQMQLQLVRSNYHGYNVSCFGDRNGSINLTVTGGAAPYTYRWSNGATTEDLSNIPAGYYNVDVTDINGVLRTAEITLLEPLALRVEVTPYIYPNLFNISCYECYNGSITTAVTGGVSPFTYLWNPDQQTTANISTLGAKEYAVRVTDKNGCTAGNRTVLRQPDRGDWTMSGNTTTNPTTNFMGTADNTDLVFRTNNTEAARLKANGNVGIGTTTPQVKLHVAGGVRVDSLTFESDSANSNELKLVGSTRDGDLVIVPIHGLPPYDEQFNPCESPVLGWYNNNCLGKNPNNIYKLPEEGSVGIGTSSPVAKLDIVSSGNTSATVALRIRNSDNKTLLKVTDDYSISGEHSTAAMYINGNTHSTDGGTVELYGNNSDRPSEIRLIGKLISFYDFNTSNQQWESNMIIKDNGQVGIGIDPDNGYENFPLASTNFKLAVNGGIISEFSRVQISENWPDYVFDKDYKMIPIHELESYLLTEKHLPGVPTADKIEKEGIDLGEMSRLLIEKVEELNLYIINLQKQIDELKATQD